MSGSPDPFDEVVEMASLQIGKPLTDDFLSTTKQAIEEIEAVDGITPDVVVVIDGIESRVVTHNGIPSDAEVVYLLEHAKLLYLLASRGEPEEEDE